MRRTCVQNCHNGHIIGLALFGMTDSTELNLLLSTLSTLSRKYTIIYGKKMRLISYLLQGQKRKVEWNYE
eukprot:g55928.t1